MFRIASIAVLAAAFLSAGVAQADGKPSPPTNTIFTYSPLFGGPLTVRAAWSWPTDWNDSKATSGTRSYITRCVVTNTGEVVFEGTAPDGPILDAIQFDVPYPDTRYTFQVYAVNKYGFISNRPGKYSVDVP